MNKTAKIAVLLGLIICLVLVRAYASQLFYDPFIAFFRTGASTQALPEVNLPKLLLHLLFRYGINTGISLCILWILFQKKEIVQLSAYLYGILFLVLMGVFVVLVNTFETGEYMLLFYVRRFLIHPLFLLLLIPAFYFQSNRK
ncbi:MAG: exosortase F system-associated protein [Flavobacteriaceae bacterium]